MLSGAVVPCLGLRTPVRAARGCLRKAVIALGDGSALHPEARIRTKPTENFSYTAPHETFVSPPLPTVCDGPSPRWRVEKKAAGKLSTMETGFMYGRPTQAKAQSPGPVPGR